jgi:hypothetical protein
MDDEYGPEGEEDEEEEEYDEEEDKELEGQVPASNLALS